mmetsp:Transcript_14676/g.18117  ORF Transcript_14676/g.18117 Transcript_14676/m.18117 type:complete len:349 (+) Transcript_14676:227-1273(+)
MWYRQAAKEYTDGIALCMAAADESNDERPIELESQLKANRGACSLALRNYGAAKKDCREALNLDKKNTKALYRLGKACLALKQWDAAMNAGELGVSTQPENAKAFREMIKFAKNKKSQALRELQTKRKDAIHIWTRIVKHEGAKLALWKSPDRPAITPEQIEWPLVIEYPELNIPNDKVERASADDLFADWLLTLLSSPPDERYQSSGANSDSGKDMPSRSRYTPDNVAIYVRVPNTQRLPFHFTSAEAYADAIAGPLPNSTTYSLNSNESLNNDEDDDDRPSLFLDIHPAASIKDLLLHPRFVVSGPIRLQLRSLDSAAHAAWRPTVEIRKLMDVPIFPPEDISGKD